MKRQLIVFQIWIVCLFSLSAAWSAPQPWPKPANYVNDYANVIDENSEREINALAKRVQDKTTAQFSVVSIESFEQRGYGSIEEAAVELFEAWGIGQKGKDNGLLILVAVKERKWRVEVGYGLEGAIPDSVADRYGRNLLPNAFRQGKYGEGLLNLCTVLTTEIAKEYNIPLSEFEMNTQAVQQAQRAQTQSQQRGRSGNSIFSMIVMVVLFLLFIKNPNLFLWLLMMNMGGNRRSHWGGGSHFGGGGSFGGGFGGFGGGRSGGGGASGGW